MDLYILSDEQGSNLSLQRPQTKYVFRLRHIRVSFARNTYMVSTQTRISFRRNTYFTRTKYVFRLRQFVHSLLIVALSLYITVLENKRR
jgi:hypothetical protein